MYNNKLWITTHQGKMKHIDSISTCCTCNPNCIKRQQDGNSICSHCYANTILKMRKTLKNHLVENTDILSMTELQDEDIPVINSIVFRLESFGDLVNSLHLKNYIKICNKNPEVHFALWTKNIHYLRYVFEKCKIEKPENLSIVFSSPKLNKESKIDRMRYYYIDHVFTVYTKNFIEENNIDINCGSKNCFECRKCYNRCYKYDEFYIREQLK